MAMCAELADLAMQLARAAAARALAEAAEPKAPTQAKAHPTAAAEPASLQAPQPPPARETAPSRTAIRTPSIKPIDPALLFTRLAAVVRDCIALETRLAAGLPDPRNPGPRAPTDTADPRRAPLRAILHLGTENHPDRAALTRAIDARLEQHFAADPELTINPAQILDAICDEFAVALDVGKVGDEHLDLLIGAADGPADGPDPRATSPP